MFRISPDSPPPSTRTGTKKRRRLAIFRYKAYHSLQIPNGKACAVWGAVPWYLICARLFLLRGGSFVAER